MAPNLRFLAELLHNVYGLPLEAAVGEDGGTVDDSRSKCEDLNPSAKVQDVKAELSPKKDLRGEGTETPVSDNDINFEDTEPDAQKEVRTKHLEKNMEKEGGVDVEASRPKQKSWLDTTDERVVGDFPTSQPVVAVNIEDGGPSRAIGQMEEPLHPNASQGQMTLELNVALFDTALFKIMNILFE